MDVDVLKQYSPAWIIHHNYYTVIVPHAVLGMLETQKWGFRRMGANEADDQEYTQSQTRARFTIMQIAEILDSGFPVSLCQPKHAIHITQAVNAHLKAWDNALRDSLVLPGTEEEILMVVEDLIKLDELQYHLHRVACNYFDDKQPARTLADAGRESRGMLFRGSQLEDQDRALEALGSYVSRSKSFKHSAARRFGLSGS